MPARAADLWPKARIERLTALWNAGVGTVEIGRQLGVTKNAAVAKANRLGLPARGNPIDYEAVRAHQAAQAPVPAFTGCRFPLWPHNAAPDGRYCGAKPSAPGAARRRGAEPCPGSSRR
jgi:GcrA cell cycle regulator